MRRGHQYHSRLTGRRKSSVSIDEVVAALRNQEFNEPTTPPLSPASLDSQNSSQKFFREKLSPSSDKQRWDGYQSGSSGNSSPSFKRYPRPRSFYNSQQGRKSVNERLHFYQKRSDEDFSAESEDIERKPPRSLDNRRNSSKSASPKKEKQKLTPADRARRSLKESESSQETTPKKQSKRKSALKRKSREEDWSKLRCTSVLSEVVAENERRRNKKKDDTEIIFAEAVFRSDTLMKFNIIKNELHNIQKSQLRRAENDFSSFNKRIESQENDLHSWEKELKSAQNTLIETSTAIEKAKKAKERAVDEMISYDECMSVLEEKLKEIRLEKN